ncbi:MAG TPA: hypothetical protein PKM10_04610 [Halanaerobiales bacterium]|nr:hypothetical protein [Halanaerobiales bacterium]
MKKWSVLLVLILLFSFCLPVYAQTGDVELFLRYQEQKKNPWVGVAAAWLVPSLGHAYAGNWERGAMFLAAELIEIGFVLWALSDNTEEYTLYYGYQEYGTENDAIGVIAGIAFFGTRIWEYIDAYQEVEKYNARLLERISIDPGFKIGKDEATLFLAYEF